MWCFLGAKTSSKNLLQPINPRVDGSCFLPLCPPGSSPQQQAVRTLALSPALAPTLAAIPALDAAHAHALAPSYSLQSNISLL